MKCTNPNHTCKGEIVTRGRYQECNQCGFRPVVAPKAEAPKAPKAEAPKALAS